MLEGGGGCDGGFPRVPAAVLCAASVPESAVINELAWAGTTAKANAEWIELYNVLSSQPCV